MKELVTINLQPVGKVLQVLQGTKLQTCLFEHGVEFPCGGEGRCKGCRIRITQGTLKPVREELALLTNQEISEGWRLACCHTAESNITLELAQWEIKVLTDHSDFHFDAKEGHGIAIDLGTTTIAAQLLSLKEGTVLGVHTDLNAQAQYGADIMSRIQFAMNGNGGEVLSQAIRNQIILMIRSLHVTSGIPISDLREVVIVGNTVMHHLFCNIDINPLAHYPFESNHLGSQTIELGMMGIEDSNAKIRFLPCLGGFVGSDILAGIYATGMPNENDVFCLIDLGTNGEIVIGNKERFLCASTAAGPAFEGARISMGMRAITGAISSVINDAGKFSCMVLGNSEPKGICGSGLVDAIATALDIGLIHSSGKINKPLNRIALTESVFLEPLDIRELQLAKGAIAAGIKILAKQYGVQLDQIKHVYLAGAFGNYINRASAIRIGLLPFQLEQIIPSGNTALLGAKMALFQKDDTVAWDQAICKKTQHINLSLDPAFQDIFAEEMRF